MKSSRIAMLVSVFLTVPAWGQTAGMISFQGLIKNAAGIPITGAVDLEFRIFDAAALGNLVDMDGDGGVVNTCAGDVTCVFAVTATSGVVTTKFGPVHPNVFDGCSAGTPCRWLEVSIGFPAGGGVFSALSRVEMVTAPATAEQLNIPATGTPALRVGPSGNPAFPDVPNLLGGHSANSVGAGAAGATIGGGGSAGSPNQATRSFGTVAGGFGNVAAGFTATVSGGNANQAGGDNATIGGGAGNNAAGSQATIGGGAMNTAAGAFSTVSGGGSIFSGNSAGGSQSTVGGGSGNTAGNTGSTVGGGQENDADGFRATVPGGSQNSAGGNYSFAAGRRAKVRTPAQVGGGDPDGDEGTFVWADSLFADFTSTGPDQFLIRAAGGVGINTSTPTAGSALTVNGLIHSTSGGFRFPNGTIQTSAATGGGGFWTASGTGIFNNNSGNVGIGTTSPSEKLDVSGNIHASGTVASGFSITMDGTAGSENITSSNDLDFRVSSGRALRLEANPASPNLIGGFSGNSVTPGVAGATIAGGGKNLVVNRVTDDAATVSGGEDNRAGNDAGTTFDARWATVSGGGSNTASALGATVGGGFLNTASGQESTISGGVNNRANGRVTTVGGGTGNVASGDRATVGGGQNNEATSTAATVGGGDINRATNVLATVAGGGGNTASGNSSNISGGDNNTASGLRSTVGGGRDNIASGDNATIGGGGGFFNGSLGNTASGDNSTIGGGALNNASTANSTVGGGRQNIASGSGSVVAGGTANTASLDASTVGGGTGNTAGGSSATVGGGQSNRATGIFSTVSGGGGNRASGRWAMVPGGDNNGANGDYSFAAGRFARVRDPAATGDADGDEGSFVWADSTNAFFFSTRPNQFNVRASGGTRIFSNAAATVGVQLFPNGNSWSALSDRNFKENLTRLDPAEILEKLAEVPITEWNLKSQDPSIRHIGPMAQDFHAAFGLGESERYISSSDADGVALAAIQGLYEIVRDKEACIDEQEAQITAQQLQISDLAGRLARLETTIGKLSGTIEGGSR